MSDRVITLRPTVKQTRFLKMHAKHCGYGGARGGGKSWVVRTKAVLLANRYGRPNKWSEGIKICIVRRTLVDVRNNHIVPLKILLSGMARYNQTERTFYFPNGSTIHFEYYDNEGHADHFQGVEFDVIFIEEATQLPEEWIKNIAASCRGANDFPHRIYYTCNPGGPGHAYIKRIFVDRIYKEDEDPNDYEFVQAKVTDNKVLMEMDPDYIKFLKNLPPKKRKAWLEGDWEIYEGQFFNFVNDPDHYDDRRWTHVINPFKPMKHWKIYRSFDWGSRRPFSCGWWAVDEDDTLYRIMEFYGVQRAGGESIPNEGLKWHADRTFAEIARIEREHRWLAGKQITGVADPAIFQENGGPPIAEAGYKYGIYFEPGDNKRLAGWDQVRYRMQFDEYGRPRMYIFANCKDTIRTIPLLMHNEKGDVEDVDTDGEDHAADEIRYMCMARPVAPIIEEQEYKPLYGSDPLNMFGGRE